MIIFTCTTCLLVGGAFFNSFQEENGIQVCIIGANIRAKFFSKIDPLGQYIKFNGIWLESYRRTSENQCKPYRI